MVLQWLRVTLILVTVAEKTPHNSWMGLCKITLSQKRKHLWCLCNLGALISPASRWEFGIIEFWEARRTSYQAHFTTSSRTDVISPILWMNGSACDARAVTHMCVQHSGSSLLPLGVTHWSPGCRPQFYEAMRYQPSVHFPQEARCRFMDRQGALSHISFRVK